MKKILIAALFAGTLACSEEEYIHIPLQSDNLEFINNLEDSSAYVNSLGDTAWFLLEKRWSSKTELNGATGEVRHARGYFGTDSLIVEFDLRVQTGVDSLGSSKGEYLAVGALTQDGVFVRTMHAWVFPQDLAVSGVQSITDTLALDGINYLNVIRSVRESDFNPVGISVNRTHGLVEIQDANQVSYRKAL